MLKPLTPIVMSAALALAGGCSRSDSPASPSTLSHDGRWSGQGPGLSLVFVVTGERVTNISFDFRRDAGCSISRSFAGLSVSIEPQLQTPFVPPGVTNGPNFRFQSGPVGPDTVAVGGIFSSTKTAGGSVGYYYVPGCDSGAVEWVAARQ